MTVAAAKEKLHDYIDHADEKKVFELLSLFVDNDERKSYMQYDEATLTMLRETSEEYLSGKSKTYTLEEFKELINQQRQ